jgi:DNA-binding PadR family transcriptional regulator
VLVLVGRDGAGPHDLVRMMRQGQHVFWAASASQWYAEPKRLTELGYLQAERTPGQTHERTHYTLTDAGRAALRESSNQEHLAQAETIFRAILDRWPQYALAEAARQAESALTAARVNATRGIGDARTQASARALMARQTSARSARPSRSRASTCVSLNVYERRITTSPAGSTWIQNQQENTSLHDALTSAVAATRGLA